MVKADKLVKGGGGGGGGGAADVVFAKAVKCQLQQSYVYCQESI